MKTLFLPGASGSASFWKPVADRAGIEGVFFSWPGLGLEPPQSDVNGLDDLVAMVANQITEPVNLISQSMGGLIAMKLALAMPTMVCRLVLTVTSGGVAMDKLGGSDWRADYFAAFPTAAAWVIDSMQDISAKIPSIKAPALLLWGDRDPISPVAVGEMLAELLPNSRLVVIAGASHNVVQTHEDVVADEIANHLAMTL